MLKKIFIISSVLLLVISVFFGIYMIAFKESDTINKKKIVKEDTEDITTLLSEKITNITSDPIVSAAIGPDGKTLRYYDALDGRIWTMTLRGTNKEVLLSETKGAPIDVKWSRSGDSAIIKYDNGEIFTYNYATGVSSKLRDGMDDVVWAGVNNKILYKYYDELIKERSLNIANSDGTDWKKITNLPFRYTSFTQIPSSTLAAFWPTADANTATELFTVSTISKSEPKKIFTDKKGADFLFAPNGKNILVSSILDSNKSVTLGVMDSTGQNYNDLLVPTITKKSVWSRDGKMVYYAQPTNVPQDVIWPNDYDEKKFTTKDTFYKMDIETGKKERIIELDEIVEKIDAVDLFLSPAEDVLFFKNRTNNLLYRLNLE